MNLFSEIAVQSVPDIIQRSIRLTIQGLSGDERLYINQVRTGLKANYQLLYSVGRVPYLNRFSPRLSITEMTGLYLPMGCSGTTPNNATNSVPAFVAFYKQYSIVSASPRLLTIAYGGLVMQGYLEELNTSDYSKDGVEGYTFTLRFLGQCPAIDGSDQNTQDDSNNGFAPVVLGNSGLGSAPLQQSTTATAGVPAGFSGARGPIQAAAAATSSTPSTDVYAAKAADGSAATGPTRYTQFVDSIPVVTATPLVADNELLIQQNPGYIAAKHMDGQR